MCLLYTLMWPSHGTQKGALSRAPCCDWCNECSVLYRIGMRVKYHCISCIWLINRYCIINYCPDFLTPVVIINEGASSLTCLWVRYGDSTIKHPKKAQLWIFCSIQQGSFSKMSASVLWVALNLKRWNYSYCVPWFQLRLYYTHERLYTTESCDERLQFCRQR